MAARRRRAEATLSRRCDSARGARRLLDALVECAATSAPMEPTMLLRRLRDRSEWKLFAVLPKADGPLAAAWWAVLVARGLLPALFAVAMGALVGAVQRGEGLGAPLLFAGT